MFKILIKKEFVFINLLFMCNSIYCPPKPQRIDLKAQQEAHAKAKAIRDNQKSIVHAQQLAAIKAKQIESEKTTKEISVCKNNHTCLAISFAFCSCLCPNCVKYSIDKP